MGSRNRVQLVEDDVLTAALLAFYLPALPAGRADPLIVMRDEESPWRMIMS